MDEFYAAEERQAAHEVKEKSLYTTYKHDNAFDRIAFSQLTAGEKPGIYIYRLGMRQYLRLISQINYLFYCLD